jgi:hypothetical protein
MEFAITIQCVEGEAVRGVVVCFCLGEPCHVQEYLHVLEERKESCFTDDISVSMDKSTLFANSTAEACVVLC